MREAERAREQARESQSKPERARALALSRESQRGPEKVRRCQTEPWRVPESVSGSLWLDLSLSLALSYLAYLLYELTPHFITLWCLSWNHYVLCSERNEYWISITWMMIAGMKSDWYANFPLPPAPTPSQWPHFHWLQSCKMSFVSHRANIEIFFTPFPDARYICEIFVTFCNFNWV